MKLNTKNGYIIGKVCRVNTNNSAVVVNNGDTNCLIQVVSAAEIYKKGDILLVDKNHTEDYIIAGERYIAFPISRVIAEVQE